MSLPSGLLRWIRADQRGSGTVPSSVHRVGEGVLGASWGRSGGRKTDSLVTEFILHFLPTWPAAEGFLFVCFLTWTISKVSVECVTILLLFDVLVFLAARHVGSFEPMSPELVGKVLTTEPPGRFPEVLATEPPGKFPEALFWRDLFFVHEAEQRAEQK